MQHKSIWVNSLVQNEDKFIWFAIMSVIDYVDRILVWDTGSTDKTTEIIKEIQKQKKDKVVLKRWGKVDHQTLTDLRDKQLQESKCDFVLVLDGDEIWPEASIQKVLDLINQDGDKIDGIVVPFYNLVGDIYHYQDESAGRYNLLGKVGHLTIRLVNRGIPGIRIKNKFPDEGFYIGDKKSLQESSKLKFLDAPYLHATHLIRSTVGKEDRRYRYKYELGHKFPRNFKYPKVLFSKLSEIVDSPLKHRSIGYTLLALLQFPLKSILRGIQKIIC